MASWGNICRVCASPADYDIFEKIPVYLHANSKDYLHWQAPICQLMQDTTGLKISPDDGLPKHICALCISYLKHAFTFREKAIEICLNFIAVKEYKEILKGKKEWNYTETVNDILATHNKSRIINENTNIAAAQQTPQSNAAEEDNTTNSYYKDHNKVNKRLITSGHGDDNSNMARVLTNQTKSCLLYLSQLYDYPHTGDRMSGGGGQGTLGFRNKQKRQNLMKSASCDIGGNGGSYSGGFTRKRQNYEDEFSRNISSDEYDEPESNGDGSNGISTVGSHKSNNILSYKEKIFEEDDIMDFDELKDMISINIESTCKEHKCKYCSRRFMFEDTIQEHLKTCVDYKFAEFFEEIKNLMYIKRCKEISPHEFIRRMVFSIRKTCLWLKENLIDTTLPDLLQSKDSLADTTLIADNFHKKTESTKVDNIAPVLQRNPINPNNNILHLLAKKTSATNQNVNKTFIGSSFLQDEPFGMNTAMPQDPINMSNNILHEIERSQSRDSNKMTLKKPIAILATSTSSGLKSSMQNMSFNSAPTALNPERLAFLEKLQNAAKAITPPPPPSESSIELISDIERTPAKETHSRNALATTNTLTPMIAVRQDLMETTTTTTTTTTTRRAAHVSPLMELLQNSTKTPNVTNTPLNPCARCPTCNLLFETLDALEIHNALQHNNVLQKQIAENDCPGTANQHQEDVDKEAEHKRIIALFENEDEF